MISFVHKDVLSFVSSAGGVTAPPTPVIISLEAPLPTGRGTAFEGKPSNILVLDACEMSENLFWNRGKRVNKRRVDN